MIYTTSYHAADYEDLSIEAFKRSGFTYFAIEREDVSPGFWILKIADITH